MRSLTLGFLSVILTMSLAHAEDGRFHPNNLFIKMKDGAALIKSPLITSSSELIDGLYLVKAENADVLAQTLQNSPAIEYVQKDFYAGKSAMPKLEVMDPISMRMKSMVSSNFNSFNDPQVSKLWGFAALNGMDVVGAYAALPNVTPKEVIVAVVDTGVDHRHEDLKDVMWENAGEVPGDGIDNDGNGYIDDIHGINTLVRDEQGRATMNTLASHWHGTHVAGTIAATQNNGVGIAGVANNVKIMAIRTVPDNADELDSDVVESFTYAAKMGAKIINCSFGKKHNEGGMVVRDVINAIGKRYGVLVIAAAGNDSMPWIPANNDVDLKFPASFDSTNLLVVAATESRGALASFSNIGLVTVDVAAPGEQIYSTINTSNGVSRYAMASGTSMATPNTVGVAAMILGYNPRLKSAGLKRIIMESVVKVPAFADKMSTGGRVNLKQALEASRR